MEKESYLLRKILVFLAALIITAAAFAFFAVDVNAATDPEAVRTLTDNEDGTYNITLSVKYHSTNDTTNTNIIITDTLTDLTSADIFDNGITSSEVIYYIINTQGTQNNIPSGVGSLTVDEETKKITWDLSDAELEDGFTYTATFRVWPGQEAYDLAASAKNGTMDSSDLPEELILDNNNYALKTTTVSPTITYTQVTKKTENGNVTTTSEDITSNIKNYDYPMPLKLSKLTIEKIWNSGMSGVYPPDEIDLYVWPDSFSDPQKVTLSENNAWYVQIYAAPGLIVNDDELNSGHKYTITEDAIDHFELTQTTSSQPMLVNGELQDYASSDSDFDFTLMATNTAMGSLSISKTVTKADASFEPNADTEFSFIVNLKDSENESLTDIPYKIYDADGNQQGTGTISDGGTIKLKGGQYAVLSDLPSGSTYTVVETAIPKGYSVDNSEFSGTITSGEESAASFVNTYKPEAVYPALKAKKYLNGDTLTKGTYSIKVTDESETNLGTFALTAANDGESSFNLSSISTPGTYTYYLSEQIPDDAIVYNGSGTELGTWSNFKNLIDKYPGATVKRDGVTYDTTKITATVTVTDDGEGNLSSSVSYSGGQQGNEAVFNNKYDASGTATIKAAKHIDGRDWTDSDQFTFELTAVDGAPLRTEDGDQTKLTATALQGVESDDYAARTPSFPELVYTYDDLGNAEEKTFTYNIHEVVPDGAEQNSDGTYTYHGMTYAEDQQVTVNVSDNGDGTLKITYGDNKTNTIDAPDFVNTYKAESTTSDEIKAVKKVEDGVPFPDNYYCFRMSSSRNDTPMPDGSEDYDTDKPGKSKYVNVANGDNSNQQTVSFGTITYTEPGDYEYTITEVMPGDSNPHASIDTSNPVITVDGTNVLLDITSHSVHVHVADDNEGKLTATVTYGADNSTTPKVFTNRKVGEGVFELSAQKLYSGATLLDGQFNYTLYKCADSNFKIDDTATVLGTATTRKQDNSNIGNIYAAIPLKHDDISHTGDQPYTGTLYFACVEDNSGQTINGITYDSEPMYAIVQVKETDDHVLRPEKIIYSKGGQTYSETYDANGNITETTGTKPTFNNNYKASGKATIDASKHISGREWKSDETFKFTLTPLNGAPLRESADGETVASLETTATASNRIVDFPDLYFNQDDLKNSDGTYSDDKSFYYRIHEEHAGETIDGLTYASDQTVRVNVHNNGDGTLRITYGDEGTNTLENPQFVNTYETGSTTASIGVRKELTGRSWKTDDSFTFTLTAGTNTAGNDVETPMPDSAETSVTYDSDGSGNVKSSDFGLITYSRPGIYRYTITEKIPSGAVKNDDGTYTYNGVLYDQVSHDAVVTVTDNMDGTLSASVSYGATQSSTPATFTNTYSVSPVSVSIPVTKELTVPQGTTGPDIAGAYQFTLTAGGNTAGVSTPMPSSEGRTVVNPTSTGGTASFGNITFTKPGIYYYTIVETGSVSGVDNDATAQKSVRVVVEDLNNGSLQAVVVGADSDAEDTNVRNSTTFTNTFTPAELDVPVYKTINGRDMRSGESFVFTLVPGDDATAQAIEDKMVVLGDESQNASSDETSVTGAMNGVKTESDPYHLTFKQTGTYTFDISENQGSAEGVTYDTSTKKLTVKVTAVDGELSAQVVDSESDDIEFTNSYESSGSYTPTGTKVLYDKDGNEKDLTEGQFQFKITYADGDSTIKDTVVSTGTNDADGNIEFDTINYSNTGENSLYNLYQKGAASRVRQSDGSLVYTIQYTATEENPGTSYQPNTQSFSFLIQVTDDGKGHLTASTVRDEIPINFVNREASTTAQIDITGHKSLTGRQINDNEFEFTFAITGEEDAPMPKDADGRTVNRVTNDAYGDISFGTITFTEADVDKTYTYDINEVKGNLGGVTYDNETKQIVIHVSRDEQNHVIATLETADALPFEFSNTYEAESCTVNIPVTKVLNADDSLNPPDITGKYTFTLSAKTDGAPMPENASKNADGVLTAEVKNDSDDGKMTFDDITFDTPGIYEYLITETGTVDGVKNDSSKSVTVAVTDNGSGKLAATIIGADSTDGSITDQTTFTNTYEAKSCTVNIPIYKQVESSSGSAPDITGKYAFTIAAAENSPDDTPLPAVKELLTPESYGGLMIFKDITFTEPGTYTYTISESGTVSGIENDSDKTVKVVVTDDGSGQLKAEIIGSGSQNVSNIDLPDNVVIPENITIFTNTYQPDAVTASISATKVLKNETGQTAPDIENQFTFTLTPVTSDAPMPEGSEKKNGVLTKSVTNPDAEGGTVNFGDITYTQKGTYEYTITESGSVDGVINDSESKKHVTVNVSDDGSGNLSAQVAGADGDGTDSTTFTNTYDNPTEQMTSVSVTKKWSGSASSSKAVIRLLSNGVKTDELLVLNDSNNWKGSFTDLPKFDSNHKQIKYTVEEEYADGFNVDIQSDGKGGYIVTNGVSEETKSVQFTKQWYDNTSGERPSTDDFAEYIHLYSDQSDKKIDATPTITDNGDDTFTIVYRDLPKYTDSGIEINYRLTEDSLKDIGYYFGLGQTGGYVSDGMTFVNSGDVDVPVHIGLIVKKEWNDNEDAKGYRPTSIRVQLKANGQPVGSPVTLSEANDWSYDFGTLKALTVDEDGNDTTQYTVEELDAPDYYSSSISAEGDSFTITNTLEPVPTDSSVTDQLDVSKTLKGRTLESDEFSFELLDSDGKVAATGTNDGNGNVTFTPVTFSEAGEYTYTLKEVNDGEDNITYDTKTYTVTAVATVNDDKTGFDVTWKNGSGEDLIFVNSWADPGGTVTVTKKVVGADNVQTAFNFTMTLTRPLSGTYGDLTFTNGVAHFTLKAGESVDVSGLPGYTTYHVREDDYSAQGYLTTSENADGTTVTDKTTQVLFTNTKVSSTDGSAGSSEGISSDISAKTGVDIGTNWAVIVLLAAAGITAAVLYKKKSSDK